MKPDEILKAFYLYLDDRPTLKRYGVDEWVPEPPSLIRFHKWLKIQTIETDWNNLSYSKLKSWSANNNYAEYFTEISDIIEDEIITNALLNNHNGNFASKFFQQKYDWREKKQTEYVIPQIIGISSPEDDPLEVSTNATNKILGS